MDGQTRKGLSPLIGGFYNLIRSVCWQGACPNYQAKGAMIIGVIVIAVVVSALFSWRLLDHRADQTEMRRLRAFQPHNAPRFSKTMVRDLPEPARRFLTFAIAEGTPLYTVAEIEMQGQFSLGDKDAPNYMAMTAKQVLAAPEGFVWKMSARSGLMRLSGSDAGHWTRFWLAGLVPIARLGGNPDHTRSAFGRYVAEAAFWTPAALLPGTGVIWESVDDDTARFTMAHNGMKQSVDVSVDRLGCPTQVVFQRWSNANSQGVHQLQPFGGVLSAFHEVQGFQVPTHIEAGNFFGTDDFFPFFIADVTDIQFP